MMTLAELEAEYIEKALSMHQGHKLNTAKALGISPATLYRKIQVYGLQRFLRPAKVKRVTNVKVSQGLAEFRNRRVG